MGPFNSPIPEPVTKVEIAGRIAVPSGTPNNQVPKGALVDYVDCYWDTTIHRFVSRTGDVIGQFAADVNAWLLSQIAAWLRFPEGFQPRFLENVTWTGLWGMLSGTRDPREYADRYTAEVVAAGIEAVSGEPVSVVDGRANSLVAVDSEPKWCLRFKNGETANAGEAARMLTGGSGADEAKRWLLELVARARE